MAGAAGIISGVAGLASAGAGIAGVVGGGGGGGGGQTAWHPSNQQMQQYMGQYNKLLAPVEQQAQNYLGTAIPQFENQTNAILNNPFQQNAQDVAGMIQSLGLGTIAPQQLAGAGSLMGLGNLGASLAPGLVQTAFDPQQSLYNRQFQQMQDQTNAINSMYGLGSSPYGAGVANQAASNFNIDWQNNQLSRELAGIRGLGGLTTDVGRAYAGASDLGMGAMGTMATAGVAPYNQYTSNALTGLNALGLQNQGVAGAFDPSQFAFSDIAQIMGIGQTGQAIGFNQGQQLGSNLGQSLAALPGAVNQLGSSINQLFAPPQYTDNQGGAGFNWI